MSHVFISYSRKDHEYARQLAEHLLSGGFNVWIDDRVDYGEDWWRAIVRAIRVSDAIIVLMTPDSDQSKWVQREITLADELDKPTFPLLLAGDLLSSEHWTMYVRTQYVDVRGGQLPADDFFNLLAKHAPRKATRGVMVTDRPSTAPGPEVGLPEILTHLPEPFAWCEIPAGQVTISDAREYGGTSGGRFGVERYFVARYPVTNTQFQVFVDSEDGYSAQRWWDFSPEARAWREKHMQPAPTGFDGIHLPRTNVTWFEAVAFCRWLSARALGDPAPESTLQITLPSEQQWQRAALGDEFIAYPWGMAFDRRLCNMDESGVGKPTPVTRYISGASPLGVVDMSGNVWEWCRTNWESGDEDPKGDYPRSVRGGSWFDTGREVRATSRDGFNASHNLNFLGFRIACQIRKT